jgi:hypothetical protein
MRAHVFAAAALVALTACNQSPDAVLRFNVDQDFYEAPALGTLERAFRREAPFYVDMADPTTLSDEAQARLALQAAWMADHPSTRFLVVAIGRAEAGRVPKDDPAHDRAQSVADYLAATGIEPDRLRVRVVPAGFGDTPFDPFLRVTTMIEEGWTTRRAVMAALSMEVVPAGTQTNEGVQGAGDVGDPVGANGGPSVPVGGTDGPAAGSGPSTTPANDTPRTGSGTTSQGPVSGGTTSDGPVSGGPASGGPSTPDTSQPSTPGGGTAAPGTNSPAPSGPEKNAAKRAANSGRGNGDEAGDPGNSGGRNQGGDEMI